MKLIQKKPETVREGGIVILRGACFWVAFALAQCQGPGWLAALLGWDPPFHSAEQLRIDAGVPSHLAFLGHHFG